ncbi:polysaccharide deacetylase family protein [Paenibacillus sp. A14]|uniref:polysaccharide deacetylase family protein n=1 Tax=Paenibacillus sp. A14 TaxID=3119820 RepID=UPI002FE386B8
MSYIERMEEQAARQSRSSKHGKASQSKMKTLIIAALILSSTSLAFCVYAAGSVIQKSKTSGSVTVTAPKYLEANETDAAKTQTDMDSPEKAAEPPATEVDKADDANTTEPGTPAQNSNPAPNQQKQAVQTKETAAQKVVYLTFDDGPSKYTNQIVNILNQKGIHATFFMIGNQLQGNEKAVKTAAQAGNYIGMHSMTHNKKTLYKSGSSAKFLKEYKQEQAMIKKIVGTTPWLIRAPYGSHPFIGKTFRDDIAAERFKMWDWTVDSKDWSYPGKPDRIIQEVKRQAHRDTEVILMHEKAQTVQALPEIISVLEKKGYSFAVYKPDQHVVVNFSKDQRL